MIPTVFGTRCLAQKFRIIRKIHQRFSTFSRTLCQEQNKSELRPRFLFRSNALPVQHTTLCFWPANIFPPPTEWGYFQHDGPSTWPEKYPEARGACQSPIDVETSLVQPSSELKGRPLTWSYGSQICKSVVNAGRGWRVDVQSGDESGLTGGPLNYCYQLVQFHCHWGQSTAHGSEHTIDGKPYVGELHFVHWNKDLHATCAEAVSAPKGLCVLAVFLQAGEANPEIEKLCDALKNIPFRDQRSELPADFDLTFLFPADHSYWTYEGSLTTPPCYESVTWIVFKHPISVSEEQLECFRSLHSHCEGEEPEGTSDGLVKLNFRPPQALNARSVQECSYT